MQKPTQSFVSVFLDTLVTDPENARLHPDANLDAITGSLELFGQVEPLVVQRGTHKVIGGNGRLAAMRAMGWTEASVVYVDCTDAEATALGLALNRTAETAAWDTDTLAALLERCREDAIDVASFGFDADAMDKIIARAARDADALDSDKDDVDTLNDANIDDEVEPPCDPKTKPGDHYTLGRHNLYCGDSVGHAAGKRQYDAVFTDPPYGVDYGGGHVDAKKRKDWGAIKNDHLDRDAIAKLVNDCVPMAPFRFVCCDWKSYPAFEQALGRPKAVCVWDKLWTSLGKGYRRQHEFIMFYGVLNRTDLSDVWQCKRATNYQHPTQKPVELINKALGDVCVEGNTVFDPFGGSGSTLLAAEQLNLNATLIELEPKYCDVIVSRWERMTGKKAILSTEDELL